MSKSKQNRKRIEFVLYYWGYTWLFVFCFGFVIFIFSQNNASFVWELDGAPILYPAFEYVGSSLRDLFKSLLSREICFETYDFSLGLGKNIIQFAGNWYFEPLSLLCMFVDEKYVFCLYQILVVLRFYLCGISFSFFCFYKKQKYVSALIGSLSYVFCFYTLYWGVRFPLFLVPMIYLPVLLIGMDKQLKEKKPTLLIFMVFLSAWTHYYYLIINTFFLGIYFIIEHFADFKSYSSIKMVLSVFVKKSVGIIKTYVVGCSMAGILFLPNIYVFFHANRGNGNFNIQNVWYYGKEYYQKLWTYIGAPVPGFSVGYEAVLGLFPLTIIGVLVILTNKCKRMKVYLTIAFLCLLLPVCSYILCGFSNINNRWIYGLVFVSSYGLCKCVPRLRKLSFKQYCLIFGYILLYWISVITICRQVESELVYVYMALYLAGVFFLLLIPKVRLVTAQVLLIILLCVQIIVWEYYLYSPTQFNYICQFMERENVRETVCDSLAGSIEVCNDLDFYRTDVIEAHRSGLSTSVLMKYRGISEYSNVMGNELYQYWLLVENAGLQERIMNYDLDGRTYLAAQTSVKYIACEDKMKSYLPYGYSYLKTDISRSGVTADVFRNEFALPLGYTYDTYMLESEFEKSLPLERQEMFLNTLVLDEDIANVEKASLSDLDNNCHKLACQIIDMNNIEKIDNEYTVKNGGGYITVEYSGMDHSETYLRLDNLNISENKFFDWTWFVDNGSGNCKSVFSMSDENYYRPDTHNYTINLGYAENPVGRCIIYIPSEGKFTMDEIEIWAQSFCDYENEINARRECVLENVIENNNSIVGDIAVDENKLLFLSIPFDRGWSAKVDGVETKLLKANYGYMALQLPKGEHQIELYYVIPGMRLGIALSIVGWGFYLGRFLCSTIKFLLLTKLPSAFRI